MKAYIYWEDIVGDDDKGMDESELDVNKKDRIRRKTGRGGILTEEAKGRKKFKGGKKDRVPVWVKSTTLDYERELMELQSELSKLQKHVKSEGLRVLLIFEGRDAAGKGGTIKRITEHLNPRGARTVALSKPSDVERSQWYFQRYVAHLPAAGEIVLFDRSWYNRSMVEPVMGFCSDEENKRFLKDVPLFESMLVKDGIYIFKFYFSVSKKEQKRRFDSRREDPLKHFKISPVDEKAQEMWNQYSLRKFQMLQETNRTLSPWTIIRSDDKKRARLGCIRHILSTMEYPGKRGEGFLQPDDEIVISGIDELRMMEDTLMSGKPMPG